MGKIFKQLARHWAACLAVVALLFVQAYCDLSLPDYTSKIVDTGIQQGGRVVAVLVMLSFALSFACGCLPGIASLSDGTRTILLTVLISCGAAVLFPVTPEAPETAGTEEVQA